jgi:fatty-acyl-CoA synthase
MSRSAFAPDWLAKRAALTPDRVGLVDWATGAETTYAAWDARATRTARLLVRLGVGKGDLVSVLAGNGPAYLDVLFACNKLGAVLHNLNWRLTPHELRPVVAEAVPRALVYGPDQTASADALREVLGDAPVVAIGERRDGDAAHIAERDAEPNSPLPDPGLGPDDPWAIFYTGGTTGRPKGAVLTHGNLAWNSVNTVTGWGLTADDVAPVQLPLFHVGGPNIFLLPLVHVGGRVVLCRGFDADETFDLVARGGITHLMGVPTTFGMLQAHARWAEAEFSALRLVISGGAPCPMPVMERFWARGVDFKTGYGLTEAAGNNFWLPAADVRRKPGSVGHPLFHVDVCIRRADGTEAEADEVGELLIRGPHVMAGYFRRPDATAEAIRDGWLHTGDLARRDADGCVWIAGREKDLFISGGENVYPAEVESVLHAHPDVAEAAVVPVPHDTWGEVGHAVVVPEPGRALDEADLRAFLAERLAGYKRPHGFTVVEALPKTAIGKLDKTALAAHVRAADLPPSPTHEALS